VRERVPAQRLGLIASTTIEIAEAGRYRLAVTSDDGVRVVVDGNVVLENWTWHAATRDVRDISLARGRHEIVIEYFQIDGARALIVELERSSGP